MEATQILPLEIWAQVEEYLHGGDSYSFGFTCTQFCTLVLQNSELLRPLCATCIRQGRLETLKWISRNSQYPFGHRYSILNAITYGHIHLVEWFIKAFELDPRLPNIMLQDFTLIQIPMIQWLMQQGALSLNQDTVDHIYSHCSCRGLLEPQIGRAHV